MTKKEKYLNFCERIYVPIFSQPYWLDAACGPENWDVWLYEKGPNILAAMPYFKKERGVYKYITKPFFCQNNGLIFAYPDNQKVVSRLKFEEHAIDAACDFIESLGLDVYEQQFHYTFKNWLPFFWRQYTTMVRYTCVISDTSNMDIVWDAISSKQRRLVQKAQKCCAVTDKIGVEEFYYTLEKTFTRQSLNIPFSLDRWNKIYTACKKYSCGKIYCCKNDNGDVLSVCLLIWDKESMYLMLGGSVPEFSTEDSYSYLLFEAIKKASEMGLKFDFEGSVIKRLYKAFCEYGAVPEPYFRIRKVFNPEIVRKEAEGYIDLIQQKHI